MKAKLIIERAQYHAIQNIDTITGYHLLNEALLEVTIECSEARIPDEVVITAVKDKWVDLPKNIIDIDNVYDNNNYRVLDYRARSTRIKLNKDGNYKVEYRRMPNDIARGMESAVPEIPELFHIKLEYYIAARVRLNFNEEDGEGMRLLAEFYDGIRSVNKALIMGVKNRRIKAPIWR